MGHLSLPCAQTRCHPHGCTKVAHYQSCAPTITTPSPQGYRSKLQVPKQHHRHPFSSLSIDNLSFQIHPTIDRPPPVHPLPSSTVPPALYRILSGVGAHPHLNASLQRTSTVGSLFQEPAAPSLPFQRPALASHTVLWSLSLSHPAVPHHYRATSACFLLGFNSCLLVARRTTPTYPPPRTPPLSTLGKLDARFRPHDLSDSAAACYRTVTCASLRMLVTSFLSSTVDPKNYLGRKGSSTISSNIP